MSERCRCGITVGELTRQFTADEGMGSDYDLAWDFADDETFAVYVIHHEEAKDARQALRLLATGLQEIRSRKLHEQQGDFNANNN